MRIEPFVADDTASLECVAMFARPEWPQDEFQKALDAGEAERLEWLRTRPDLALKPQFPLDETAVNTISQTRARAQRLAFIEFVRSRGVEVIEPLPVAGCVTQSFTRDVGFVVDDIIVLARPVKGSRIEERAWLDELVAGHPRLVHLRHGSLEGGDVQVLPGRILIGVGERSDAAAVNCLRDTLAGMECQRATVTLEFAMADVVHLDCVFNAVSPELALVYLPAFTPDAQQYLRRQFRLIEVSAEEAGNVLANVVVLRRGEVVVDTRAARIGDALADAGLSPIPFEFDEVAKGWGSFHCSTLPLRRR